MAESTKDSNCDLKMLGCGVDNRQSESAWQEHLMSSDSNQIRTIGKDHNNVQFDDPAEYHLSSESWTDESGNQWGAFIGEKNKFTSEKNEAAEDKRVTEYSVLKVATLKDDIRWDPDAIKVDCDGNVIYHSNFEERLCKHILEFAEKLRMDSNLHPKLYRGKQVQQLQGDCAIGRLSDFTNDKKPRELWETISFACLDFIENKIHCTHYVYRIALGMKKTEVKTTEKGTRNKGGGIGMYLNITGNADTQRRGECLEIHKHGNESEARVIDRSTKPVHTLIHEKSENLRNIMKSHTERFSRIKNDELSGPYTISCIIKDGRTKVYWCVSDEEILGTTKHTEASDFYIKYMSESDMSPSFCISHKDSDCRESFVIFNSSRNRLELAISAEKKHSSFALDNRHREAIMELPTTPADWAKQGPFFIRRFKGRLSLQERFTRSKGKESYSLQSRITGYDDLDLYTAMEMDKDGCYKLVSCNRIANENAHTMLFSVEYQYYRIKLPEAHASIVECIPLLARCILFLLVVATVLVIPWKMLPILTLLYYHYKILLYFLLPVLIIMICCCCLKHY